MPFEPSDTDPPVLDQIVSGPAAALTAVALLAGPSARASGWAAAAAVAVARAWSGKRRVILADLDFAAPALHEALAVGNDEGMADIVDYGLSLGHVLRVVDDGAFDLIPAGLFALDPAASLRAPAWERILGEVGERRATLLAWLPADAEGADAFIDRAGAVLLLADADEWTGIVERLARPYGVIGVLTPAGAAAEPDEPLALAAAADEVLEQAPVRTSAYGRLSDDDFERIRLPKDRASRDSLIADLRERQRAARMAPPVPDAPAAVSDAPTWPVTLPAGAGDAAVEMRLEAAADDLPADPLDPAALVAAPAAPAGRGLRWSVLAWPLFVVALLSLLAGAWHFLSGRLGMTDAPAPEVPVVTAPPVVAPPQPQALPWVVAVEAHRDVATAFSRVDALGQAATSTTFHVAPLERDGTLFYHVMAGPVADSAAAVALRDTLIAQGHKTGATPTDVRATPLAFLIGDYGTRDSAQEQLELMRRLDVPGYMIVTDAADGAPVHRIYVGGFASEAEAEVIRQMLRSAGIRDSLVTRTGSSNQ